MSDTTSVRCVYQKLACTFKTGLEFREVPNFIQTDVVIIMKIRIYVYMSLSSVLKLLSYK
jgi:hypothetical protein